jgi:hypothetical protein
LLYLQELLVTLDDPFRLIERDLAFIPDVLNSPDKGELLFPSTSDAAATNWPALPT